MANLKKSTPRPWIPVVDKAKWQDDKTNKFYQSSKWRRVRNSHIKSEPLCRECKSKGIIKQADVVDHIVSIRFGGAPYSNSNLQSLCTSCHNSKSGKEGHGIITSI